MLALLALLALLARLGGRPLRASPKDTTPVTAPAWARRRCPLVLSWQVSRSVRLHAAGHSLPFASLEQIPLDFSYQLTRRLAALFPTSNPAPPVVARPLLQTR